MNISSSLKTLFTPAKKAPAAPKPKKVDPMTEALKKAIIAEHDYYQAHPEAARRHQPGMGDYAFWSNPASYRRFADQSFWANPSSYNHGN